MTIEHAPSTNGRVHVGQPSSDGTRTTDGRAADAEEHRPLASRIIMPLVLMGVALFVLRRLNKGNVV